MTKNKLGVVLVMAATVGAACVAQASESDAIRIVNGKMEIDGQLKELAAIYEEQTGQAVEIESSGSNAVGLTKGYYQAGNMPDAFFISSKADYDSWDGLCADLSDCAFAADTDMALVNEAGEVVGFPYAVEGYGLTYNADILEAAGIDPATLTTYSAYEEAFAKLDSMKEELGLTAVCSVGAESGQLFWSTGNHIMGAYLSSGVARDDKTYINMLLNGEIDTERMTQFGKFFQMMCQYSDQQTLISGSYDDQLALWCSGKAAFITQGNWIDVSLADYDVTFDCGIAPFAFTEEETPGILVDCASWWLVYGESDKVEETKAFLDWLATSQEGQEALVKDCGMVSPYNSCAVEPEYPLAISLSSYIAEGNTYAWDWCDMPEGASQEYFALVFEAFAKGDVDVDNFVSLMASQVEAVATAN